ncbi:MAG: DUF4129 domain-containing protein [Dehalococcoidia bacterium]|nr:DUF4129 domain-containing protein [Dehalococcoidia bacterium]MSQ16358.1 DUF4129 domain-containing protein [Dehalococcoidia bacterium]
MSQFWRTSTVTGAVLFMEVAAFYLGIAMVSAAVQLPEARLPYWMVGLALVWAYLLSMYVQTVRFSLNLRGALGLVLSLVSLLLMASWSTGLGFLPLGPILNGDLKAVAALVLTLAFLLLVWWRGSSLAHDEVVLETVRGSFQWGLAVVFAAALADSFTGAEIASGFLIVSFFGVGLAGMALARFTSESGAGQGMSGQWFLAIGASIGAVLLVGVAISALGLGGLDDVTRSILRLVGAAGTWLLRPVLMVSGYLVGLLVELSHWLARMFGGGDLSSLDVAAEQIRQFHESLQKETQSGGPPEVLLTALKWLAVLAVSLLVGWVLFRAFRFRRLLRAASDVEETRESLFSWTGAGQDMSSLLGDWWNNLVKASEGEGGRRVVPRDPREVYHALLLLAQRLGRPRREWQTPREHQGDLQGVLPAEPVGRIVSGFQLAHYGQGQVDDAEMARLLQAWAALNQPETEGDKEAAK